MSNEVVIVTGGAGALGSTLVRTLIARGTRVAALDVPQAAARLESMQREFGHRCIALAIDVRDERSWTDALHTIHHELGDPTGAALIAGTWDGGKPLHETTDDTVWNKMHATNVETAYRSLRALLPGMVSRRRGSIVVIGSRAVDRPWESAGAAAYAAAKSAVVALAEATAAEVLAHDVRINAVLPSIIDTPANRAAMSAADPAKWVSAENLAKVIAFLLSEDARDITGAALPVNGRV
jgi:NAD(P)-dependent dehydrogenase (short-subunit alcohol dehydrogenase family)